MARRQCAFRKPDGSLCQAPPLKNGTLCLFHDPEHAAEAAEAHRLGGLRRKREVTVAGAYDFEGLDSIPRIRRLLEVAVIDVLSGAENAIPRARAIMGLALAAEKLLRTGELEDRIEELEAAVKAHEDRLSAFDERDELGAAFPLEGE